MTYSAGVWGGFLYTQSNIVYLEILKYDDVLFVCLKSVCLLVDRLVDICRIRNIYFYSICDSNSGWWCWIWPPVVMMIASTKIKCFRFDWIRFVSNKTGNKKHLQQKLCGFFIRIFFFLVFICSIKSREEKRKEWDQTLKSFNFKKKIMIKSKQKSSLCRKRSKNSKNLWDFIQMWLIERFFL